jgi:hypothetical protein
MWVGVQHPAQVMLTVLKHQEHTAGQQQQQQCTQHYTGTAQLQKKRLSHEACIPAELAAHAFQLVQLLWSSYVGAFSLKQTLLSLFLQLLPLLCCTAGCSVVMPPVRPVPAAATTSPNEFIPVRPVSSDHAQQLHNVWVACRLEDGQLPYTCDRQALPSTLKAHLLQRHNLPRGDVARCIRKLKKIRHRKQQSIW